jgi:type IV secretory pathway VirB4 component
MKLSKTRDTSLSEELPYWDFIDGLLPHMVLSDGSLSAGLKVNLCDIECLDDSEVNHFVMGLRSSLNSVSEGSSVQFMLAVTSDYRDVLKKHVDAKSQSIHPLVESIAKFRESKLTQAADNSELYRPELTIFIRSPMAESKKKWFFRKKSEFSADAIKAYNDTLEVLSLQYRRPLVGTD